VRLADAPEHAVIDGAIVNLPTALLRGDPRLEALFARFHEAVALSETLSHDSGAARVTRLLAVEIRADVLDDVRAVVREVCPKSAFEEKPTERDDVAGGTEWRERSGSLSVSVYRLFGGSTALHVTAAKVEPAEAPMEALRDSPLADVAELVDATSFVEQVSCSRTAGAAPQWYLRAKLRDLRRFEEIAPRIVALGFEDRRGKYWRDQTILQPVGKERWMAAVPGIDFGS
jgi:hypothetical protein